MRRSKNTLKRSTRVFLNDLNQGKAEELRAFLYLCHDVMQYLIDLFWARGEMTASFADLETVHLAKSRFGITTRLAQALATAPFRSTAPINKFLSDGWAISKTARLGMRRQQIKEELAREIKKIDLAEVKTVVVEDLKRVKDGKRGTFSRTMNRRLSHWQYAYAVDLLGRRCEIEGVRLERKDPWKTSQHCPACGRWDKRNRRGDKFCCVICGHSDHADFKAAKTLELLGLAGVYGLRSLPSLTFASLQN